MIDNSSILVVIQCLAYNHEPYIRDCLEGFVMQKTNFRFVAIVHDDASTDKTADIIREYEAKYPEIIKPIYETENQYSKKDDSLGRILDAAIYATGAKYIAMCEGDDYWTDPYKLQKQVDFLENNMDFSICYHKVKIWDEESNVFIADPVVDDNFTDSLIVDLAKGNCIHTLSVMYRRNLLVDSRMKKFGVVRVGDYLYHMIYAEYGKIHRIDDCMGVYRQGVGVWTKNVNPMRQSVDWLIAISKLYSVLTNEDAKKVLDEQIQSYRNSCIELYNGIVGQERMARLSKSYRLGHFLLHPLSIFKRK